MYSNSELITAISQGLSPKYLFFWGHTPSVTGEVTKSCLSQWYDSPFILDGLRYLTAEHYMMAQKAKLFADDDVFAQVIACSHPNEAKKLGRMVKNFDAQTWEKYRFDIVVQGNLAKFNQHLDLKAFFIGDRQTSVG